MAFARGAIRFELGPAEVPRGAGQLLLFPELVVVESEASEH